MNSNSLRQAISCQLQKCPQQIAVTQIGSQLSMTLAQLQQSSDQLAEKMTANGLSPQHRIIGIAIDPCFDWIIADIMALNHNAISLPVPTEFSDEQLENLLKTVDCCLVNNHHIAQRIINILPDLAMFYCDGSIANSGAISQFPKGEQLITEDIVKVIHTSGTTSSPKGVLIRDEGIGQLSNSLLHQFSHIGAIKYLSMVPFSLLIEQVLGLYLPILSGGCCVLPPQGLPPFSTQLGLATHYLSLFNVSGANFAFLPPKLLEEAIDILKKHEESMAKELFGSPLPHLVTGGAKTPHNLLEELAAYGVTIYEGYGLSENSSVVALNLPGTHKIGSVGKPLPGVELRFIDGELAMRSHSLCAGYSATDTTSCEFTEDGFLMTGDLAYQDKDGYLFIDGRRKNVIILSTARNVSPEWVENTYKQSAHISDVVVFGDGQEKLSGVVFTHTNVDHKQIKQELEVLAKKLPSYARIEELRILSNNPGLREKYFTLTGRPIRQLIEHDFSTLVEAA